MAKRTPPRSTAKASPPEPTSDDQQPPVIRRSRTPAECFEVVWRSWFARLSEEKQQETLASISEAVAKGWKQEEAQQAIYKHGKCEWPHDEEYEVKDRPGNRPSWLPAKWLMDTCPAVFTAEAISVWYEAEEKQISDLGRTAEPEPGMPKVGGGSGAWSNEFLDAIDRKKEALRQHVLLLQGQGARMRDVLDGEERTQVEEAMNWLDGILAPKPPIAERTEEEAPAKLLNRPSAPIGSLTSAQCNIVAVLRNAGRRLVTMQILAELERQLGPTSEGTTKQHLAELTRRRLLTNGSDRRGTGYGLPEWNA